MSRSNANTFPLRKGSLEMVGEAAAAGERSERGGKGSRTGTAEVLSGRREGVGVVAQSDRKIAGMSSGGDGDGARGGMEATSGVQGESTSAGMKDKVQGAVASAGIIRDRVQGALTSAGMQDKVQGASTSAGRKQKAYSCEECECRKLKCDGVRPMCDNCAASGRRCVYD